MEIFKEIKDYPDYQISNYGNVKSLKLSKTRILKPGITKKGYQIVNLCNNSSCKSHYIHILCVSTFIRDIKKLEQIDHRDTNKLNNRLDNLDIVDNRINQLRIKKGKHLPGVFKSGNKFSTKIQISYKTVYLESFNTEKEAHEAYKNKLKEYGINIDFSQDLACVLDDNKI